MTKLLPLPDQQHCSIPPDPLWHQTILHPREDGVSVGAKWAGLPGPRGNLLIFHQLAFGNPDWAGVMEVTITATQEGRPAASRTTRITKDDGRVGLAFCLENDTYNYELSIRLASPHYVGSALGFGPLAADSPIPESPRPGKVYRIDGAKVGDHARMPEAIISANQGGLMNRTYPMLSTVCAAEKTGRSAYVYWAPNTHCAADLADLFDMTKSGFEEVDSSFIADSFARHSFYQADAAPLPLTDKNMLVYSTVHYPTEVSPAPSFGDLAAAFGRFTPAPAVLHNLSKFDGVDFSRTIGFHLRRAYPNGAFAKLEGEKFAIGEEVFIDLLERLRTEFPQFTRAFLCTNDLGTEARIKEHFGDYVFTFDKTSIDNTIDHVAVQEAMVDLMLMARCPVIFSQNATSFGHFAHVLGNNTMFQMVTDQGSPGRRFYTWREGSHRDTFEVGDNLDLMRHRLPGYQPA